MKAELAVFFHGLHEVATDPNGNIGFCHFIQVCLQFNEVNNIRMGTINGNHEGSTAPILPNQLCYKGIKGHEGNGTARLLGRVVDMGSFRAQF